MYVLGSAGLEHGQNLQLQVFYSLGEKVPEKTRTETWPFKLFFLEL